MKGMLILPLSLLVLVMVLFIATAISENKATARAFRIRMYRDNMTSQRPPVDTTETVRIMNGLAVRARQGVGVRAAEREIRWRWEQLDYVLSKGADLPQQWRTAQRQGLDNG